MVRDSGELTVSMVLTHTFNGLRLNFMVKAFMVHQSTLYHLSHYNSIENYIENGTENMLTDTNHIRPVITGRGSSSLKSSTDFE